MDYVTGFLNGLTFYPFPCVLPHAFAGWSDAKLMSWLAGVITVARRGSGFAVVAGGVTDMDISVKMVEAGAKEILGFDPDRESPDNAAPDWAAAELRQNRIEALRAASRIMAGICSSHPSVPEKVVEGTLIIAEPIARWLEKGER